MLSLFHGTTHVLTAPARDIALHLHDAAAGPNADGFTIIDDSSGRTTDLDLTGTRADLEARYSEPKRPRGRPKLGVTAREITLLPRHWDWLNAQPRGASATIRRLIDAARAGDDTHPRQRIDATFRFLQTFAGDLPGFETATRALYASDRPGFAAASVDWPEDIRAHAERMLDADPD